MNKSTINRLPKATVELTITVSWQRIQQAYQKALERTAQQVEIPGFRKGKAPAKLAEEKIDRSKLYEKVIEEVVPEAYSAAIKEHDLKPITSPRIELVKAKENEDWQIKVTVAERPTVTLGNYREAVAQVKNKRKIWLPGQKEEEKKDEKVSRTEKLTQILKVLLQSVKMELPDLLVENEVQRMLARLIDDTRKLGLTLEQYLKASGKTVDQVRQEYQKQADESLKLEFILEEIAEKEGITISQTEIDKAILQAKDEKERDQLKQQSYYLAAILRRQKTLDNLLNP